LVLKKFTENEGAGNLFIAKMIGPEYHGIFITICSFDQAGGRYIISYREQNNFHLIKLGKFISNFKGRRFASSS